MLPLQDVLVYIPDEAVKSKLRGYVFIPMLFLASLASRGAAQRCRQ